MTNPNSQLSGNAGLGSKNQTTESEVDVEREPMPGKTPEVDSDKASSPPARSGNVSEHNEKPTEGDPNNPVHHTGHIPPPVTANRD